MAVLAYVAFIYAGIKKFGFRYFKNQLIIPGVPMVLVPFLALLEFLLDLHLASGHPDPPVAHEHGRRAHCSSCSVFSATAVLPLHRARRRQLPVGLLGVGTFAFGIAFTLLEIFVAALQALRLRNPRPPSIVQLVAGRKSTDPHRLRRNTAVNIVGLTSASPSPSASRPSAPVSAWASSSARPSSRLRVSPSCRGASRASCSSVSRSPRRSASSRSPSRSSRSPRPACKAAGPNRKEVRMSSIVRSAAEGRHTRSLLPRRPDLIWGTVGVRHHPGGHHLEGASPAQRAARRAQLTRSQSGIEASGGGAGRANAALERLQRAARRGPRPRRATSASVPARTRRASSPRLSEQATAEAGARRRASAQAQIEAERSAAQASLRGEVGTLAVDLASGVIGESLERRQAGDARSSTGSSPTSRPTRRAPTRDGEEVVGSASRTAPGAAVRGPRGRQGRARWRPVSSCSPPARAIERSAAAARRAGRPLDRRRPSKTKLHRSASSATLDVHAAAALLGELVASRWSSSDQLLGRHRGDRHPRDRQRRPARRRRSRRSSSRSAAR